MDVGVLGVLKYGSRVKLEAITKLSSREEGGFNDPALRLEAMKRLVSVLEKEHEKGEVGEEELCEAVYQFGWARGWMKDTTQESMVDCFSRAKKGFEKIGNQEKTLEVAANLACLTHRGDELIKELRELLEKAEGALGKKQGDIRH